MNTGIFDPNASTTQISNTASTYLKIADFLNGLLQSNDSVLDYGAGLGKGFEALRHYLPNNLVFSYEPFPKNRFVPTYTDPTSIREKFNAIVCLYVVNVVSKEVRDSIVKHILSLLKPEGIAIIGARSWKNDIQTGVKNFEEGPEPNSVWVLRPQKGKIIKVYQKGFEGSELKDYVQSFTDRDVIDLKSKFARSTVLVEPELTNG